MDLSALIFVALAVAWVVYLVPKALKHHEEDAVSRSVDGFSDRLRVLARRDAVSSREAALVASTTEASAEPETETAPKTAPKTASEPVREERTAAPTPAPRSGPSPAQRRRRVLSVLLLALVAVAGLAAGGVLAWAWTAAPVVLLTAWLVACRLMVKAERRARAAAPVRRRRTTLADEAIADEDAEPTGVHDALSDDTDEIPAVTAEVIDETGEQPVAGWTPVPVTLPTYVAKAPAGRTVRTIDLDSTGVWSSGRNEADSQLAREADAQRAQAGADAEADERRASGS